MFASAPKQQQRQSSMMACAAVVLLALSSASVQLVAATPGPTSGGDKPTLALGRSYRVEQQPIRNFDILVQADRERAIALGRHKDQTPVEETVASDDAAPKAGFRASAASILKNAVALTASGKSDAKAATIEERQTTVVARNDIGSYLISIGVGEPATQYNRLIVDTGSANTWVGGDAPYVQTSTSVNTGNQVGMNYGIGSFRGNQFIDTVTLIGEDGDILTAREQGIGSATQQTSFDGLDGVLGLGPTLGTDSSIKLPDGSFSPDLVPTVVDTLAAQGEIPQAVVGLSLVPYVSSSSRTGLVTFGGVESDQYNGDIMYFPKAVGPNIQFYWGFDISSLRLDVLNADGEDYTTNELLGAPAQGIVDSGTTLVGLSAPTFAAYRAQFPGSAISQPSGLMTIPLSEVARAGNMTFTIGGEDYIFPSYAQIFPNEIAAAFLGGNPAADGVAVSVFTNTLYSSADSFTLGQYFLERYYSVYDTTNNRVGLAYTDYTFDNTTESTSARRTKRAHRDHEKRHNWVDGKSRIGLLSARSPFRGQAASAQAY